MSWWWSWLLAGLSAAGLLAAGDRRRSGWIVSMAVQPLWLVYAIATRQWGFAGGAVLFGAVYAVNWLRWGTGEARYVERKQHRLRLAEGERQEA